MFRLDEFMAGFNTISLKLKEMYQVCAQYILIFTPINYVSKASSGRLVGLAGTSKCLQRPALDVFNQSFCFLESIMLFHQQIRTSDQLPATLLWL